MDVNQSPTRGRSGQDFARRGRRALDAAAPGDPSDAGILGSCGGGAPGWARRRLRRPSALCLLILFLPLIAACEQRGLSGRDAEWSRQQGDGFRVVKATHSGAVINAQGQHVMVDPAPGFCLAEDSIETSRRSVFLLIGDCAVEGPATSEKDTRGELQLPKAVPGIMTVSISGDPGFRSADGSYDKLLKFLKTSEGRAMLGRSGSGEGVEIKESREEDGALMLFLEDSSTDVVPILSNRFWRAFIELHGRLAVVTMSGFRDRPMGREKMYAYLVSQVQTLGVANPGAPETPETRLAAAGGAGADPSDDWVRVMSAAREKAAAAGAAADGAGAGTDGTAAVTPATEPAIPRGNSPLERKMVLPPPRPGSGRPAARVPVTAPAPATTVPTVPATTDATAPATTDATGPVRPILTPRAAETTPAPATGGAPEPGGGPATKYAPRTAPIAPKRR